MSYEIGNEYERPDKKIFDDWGDSAWYSGAADVSCYSPGADDKEQKEQNESGRK